MKVSRPYFAALYGLLMLLAVSVAPIAVRATCPDIIISCSNGSQHNCVGHQEGTKCVYDAECLGC